MEREYFNFKRSYFDATRPLEYKHKAQLYDAICELSLNGNEVELDELPKAMFNLIRNDIDRTNKLIVNGSKGGRPKTKAETKAKPNDKPNDKPKQNQNDNQKLEERKARFKAKVISVGQEKNYKNLKEINNFIDYWSEHSEQGRKMRFEKQPVFDISRRLLTWFKNSRTNESQGMLKTDEKTLDKFIKNVE